MIRNELNTDFDELYKELRISLKKEILEELKNTFIENNEKIDKIKNKEAENKVVSKKKIDETLAQDMKEIKMNGKKQVVIIDTAETKLVKQQADEEKKRLMNRKNEALIKNEKNLKTIPNVVTNNKNLFKSTKINRMNPKKMWIPIPNRFVNNIAK